jgi:uncharacterized protein YcbK (DUF882 family)
MLASIVVLVVGINLGQCSSGGGSKVEQRQIKIRHFGDYRKVFNDINEVHLQAAKKWGVPKIQSRDDAEKHSRQLTEIKSGKLYRIDKLTHSIPFLVPRAKALLDDIGQAFQDSLRAQGVGSYQIIVTSVLRSQEDVKHLKRTNGNASANSAHCYGTTIDISHKRFERTDDRYPYDIPDEHLRHILAEVIRDKRKEGRCYVKYEVKQACFHITVR